MLVIAREYEWSKYCHIFLRPGGLVFVCLIFGQFSGSLVFYWFSSKNIVTQKQ